MTKRVLVLGLLFAAAGISAQEIGGFKVTGDLTAIYTLGNASEEEQSIGSGAGNGVYEEQRNGFYTSANVYIQYKPVDYIEGYVRILAVHRPGSLYMPLQLEYYGQSDFSMNFDTLYGKVSPFKALGFDLPVDLTLKAGKYKTEASYFNRVSRYETESVLYMLKTANTYNYEAELVWEREINASPFRLTGAFTTNYRFDEAAPRLYDEDGSVSDHGTPVLSEYAPQIFGSVRLHSFTLGPGTLQGELLYALNGADIYSGNSIGAGFRYSLPVIPSALSLPIGLGFAYYEKNIDAMSGTSGTTRDKNTTDLRETVAAGLGIGARYTAERFALDANLGFALYSVNHIYRDPLAIVSASLDAQCTYADRYIFGAGLILGSLTGAEWKTKDGAVEKSVAGGAYLHEFGLAENLGYEVYLGLKLFKNSRFIIGFNQNKGLAMNRTLEAKDEGQIKYRQAGTETADQNFEIGGLFFKFMLSW